MSSSCASCIEQIESLEHHHRIILTKLTLSGCCAKCARAEALPCLVLLNFAMLLNEAPKKEFQGYDNASLAGSDWSCVQSFQIRFTSCLTDMGRLHTRLSEAAMEVLGLAQKLSHEEPAFCHNMPSMLWIFP